MQDKKNMLRVQGCQVQLEISADTIVIKNTDFICFHEVLNVNNVGAKSCQSFQFSTEYKIFVLHCWVSLGLLVIFFVMVLLVILVTYIL